MTDFQIGGPVTDLFVDRKRDLELILNGIDRNNYALTGLRRTGKTSLALKVGENSKNRMIIVYFDISFLTPLTEVNFLKVFMKEVIDSYCSSTKQLQLGLKFKDFLKGAKDALIDLLKSSHISIRDTVEVWFKTEEQKDLTTMVKTAMELPEKLAEEGNVQFLIILDEFPRLLELKNDDFIWALRSYIHRAKKSHYIISGSSISTMRYLLEDRKSPFYGTLITIKLKGLEDNGADELLERLDKEVSSNSKIFLKELTGNFPLYLQTFCYLLSLNPKKNVNKELIESVIPEVFRILTPHFEQMFGTLGSFKKDILSQMALKDFTTAAQLAQFFEKTPNYINTYLRRLVYDGFLEREKGGKYQFGDPFLKLWIVENIKE